MQRAQANLNALDSQLRLLQSQPSPDAAQVQRANAQRQALLAEVGAL